MTIEKALEAGKEDKRKAAPDASLAPGPCFGEKVVGGVDGFFWDVFLLLIQLYNLHTHEGGQSKQSK